MVVKCVEIAAQEYGISYDAAFHLVCGLLMGLGFGTGFAFGCSCSFIMSFGLRGGQGLTSVLKKMYKCRNKSHKE